MTRALVVAGAILAAAAAHARQGGPPPANVAIAVASMETVQQRTEVTGEVRPVQVSRVAAREPGRVVEMLVNAGDAVDEGEVIARLDDSLVQTEVQAAGAEVRRVRAQLEEREADLERFERDLSRLTELFERNAASQSEYDDARTAVTAAVARRDQTNAEIARYEAILARLEQRLADMTIRAPFKGRIVSRLIEEGEWANEGAPMAGLVAVDEVDVWIDVPQRFVSHLSGQGASIDIRIDAAGVSLQTAPTGVVPLADSAARTFPVRVRIPSRDGAIKPGMSAVASVPTGESGPSLLVPADALLRDDAGWFIYTGTGEPGALSAIPARVQVQFYLADRAVVRTISGPLFPGAAVVIEGNERILFPGQPLAVSNPEALPPPPAGKQGGS